MLDLSLVVPARNPVDSLLARLMCSIPAAIGHSCHYEVVVVDDGSEEAVTSKLGRLTDLIPPDVRGRCRVVRLRQPAGCGAARNVGVWASRGEFLLFVDYDDRLCEAVVERMAVRARRKAVVYADHVVVDAARGVAEVRSKAPWRECLERFRGTRNSPFLFSNFLAMPVVVHRDDFLRVGGYPEECTAGEHVTFYGRLALQEGLDFLHVPLIGYEYYLHSRSGSKVNPIGHVRAKAEAFIQQAVRRGMRNWVFSGQRLKEKGEPKLYLPLDRGNLIVPEWAVADLEYGFWHWAQ